MIYVVRHGQTDWNKKRIYQGRKDIELNDTGIKQAQSLRDELKKVKFDFVFASPLKRAVKTAEIIAEQKIITDERLIERCNGEFEGKFIEECPSDYDFNDPLETRYGIEPIKRFKNRIISFLEELKLKYYNKNILIVTHAGVSLYIREYFEGPPKDNDFSNYKLKNCEVLTYCNN